MAASELRPILKTIGEYEEGLWVRKAELARLAKTAYRALGAVIAQVLTP
jgi:hypothetical protein